jgi:hypothetical protein
VSFSAAGSKTFQLDRVEELAKGDILRIAGTAIVGTRGVTIEACCPPEATRSSSNGDLYLEVADKPDGLIVPLVRPLPQPIPVETAVAKVTDFAVFDSMNVQEHNLFLGHAELLNLESAAELTLRVKHLAGTATNLPSLTLQWEYGVEADSADGVGWLPFDVLADTTVGFRMNGSISLRKPEGEIIETEIAGQRSRWIRAQVRGPIPGAPPPRLPRLDEITFTVRSTGTGIEADALFHNDAAIELPGRPFGPEPRQFDRFYIGSEEVFSKKQADIELNVELLAKANLSSPASIQFRDNVRVFARGANGRLVEVTIPADGSAPGRRATHEAIPDASIAIDSTPAALATTSTPERIFVVVRDENGQLHERFFNPSSSEWEWTELNAPAEGAILDPAIAIDETGNPEVFVVGTDFNLYSKKITAATGRPDTTWSDHGRPANQFIASSPVSAGIGTTTHIYVCDNEGRIHRFSLADGWQDISTTAAVDFDERLQVGGDRGQCNSASPGVTVETPFRSRVFATLYNDGVGIAARLAFRSTGKKLVVLRVDSSSSILEVDLTRDVASRDGPTLASAPAGVLLGGSTDPGESLHLFVRDCANQVWYRSPDRWRRLDRPGRTSFRLWPSAIHSVATSEFVRVFITQADLLTEFRFQYESDTARGGSLRTLVLDITASANDDEYKDQLVYIDRGDGADAILRPIAAYGGPDRVVRVDAGGADWPDVPTNLSEYRILGAAPIAAGEAIAFPADNRIHLEIGTEFEDVNRRVNNGEVVVILLKEAVVQIRDITSVVDESNGIVEVNAAWAPVPIGTPEYEIYEIVHQGPVDPRSNRTVALGPSSQVNEPSASAEDFYTGAELRFIANTVRGEVRVVESYSGAAQVALLEEEVFADSTSAYEILVPITWVRYEDPDAQRSQPELAWEYWNGSGWLRISGVKDGTANFLRSGLVSFRMPVDIQPTQVGGQENNWIRARLVGGDYGREVFSIVESVGPPPGNKKIQQLQSTKEGIEPPLIVAMTIAYDLTEQVPPQQCIANNNLSFLDQTAACTTPGRHFEPFVPLEDRTKSIYLGFEKPLRGGPIGILFVAEELRIEETNAPKMVWTFRLNNKWSDLKAADDSKALAKQGLLRFQVPAGFQLRSLFGASRYWIRGSMVDGEYLDGERPRLEGVFPNSVMTVQAGTTLDEILGSSDGEANQEFEFLPARDVEPQEDWSIIGAPKIRVRESLSPEDRSALVGKLGDESVIDIEALGEKETWVLWTEVSHFFGSTATDRHYQLDRARGRVRFGDGRRGMIPPAGADSIRAFSYRAGGGDQGNVKAGEVNTLVTAIAGVESVVNPVDAGGGGDRASVAEMQELGPARFSHRARAVTPEDFEWLAREASREVARARCRPNFEVSSDPGDEGRARPGWVTIYVVPRSAEDRPAPSFQLQRAVRRHLEAAAESGLSASGRIAVRPPRYVPISVEADVFAKSLDLVGAVEQAVDTELRRFLHPLKGGPEDAGWAFGRPVAASDVFVRLESLAGVDHVENLRLHFKDRTDRELARIQADEMIAFAEPDIRIHVD